MDLGKDSKKSYSTDEILFQTIYIVQTLEKELNKAQSKIRKLEKALNYKKIAKYTHKYLGKSAKDANKYCETTWADLEKYLGL